MRNVTTTTPNVESNTFITTNDQIHSCQRCIALYNFVFDFYVSFLKREKAAIKAKTPTIMAQVINFLFTNS